MTTTTVRKSQNRAIIHRAKNEIHSCGDCSYTVGQHALGRSAHDRMSGHTATAHHKFLDRDCKGAACRASTLTPRHRRG